MSAPTRSALVNRFVDQVRAGERLRCGVIVGPGGYGKTLLAEEAVAALKSADVPVVFVAGDLVLDPDLENTQAVVLDVGEQAPSELLDRLRGQAQDPMSGSSILVFTRSVSSSPSMAALGSLADREGALEQLGGLDAAELENRIPNASGITLEDLDELTAAIPAVTDRLCASWDDEGWPTAVSDIDTTPSRFRTFVEMQLAMLDNDSQHDLAKHAILRLWSPDSDERVGDGLRRGGLAGRDGRVPLAVAMAVDEIIDRKSRAAVMRSTARSMIGTDPTQAAGMFEAVDESALAAVARAASGDSLGANRLLMDLPRSGAAAAAAAHVAGVEARWSDAAQLIKQATPHPYWDEAQLASAQSLYELLAAPAADHGTDRTGASESFLEAAVAAMHRAVSTSSGTDRDTAVEALRSLLRQVPNQPPMLDIPITGSELASLAALTLAEFDLARSFVGAAPESPHRSALAQAIDGWLSTRTGQISQRSMSDHDASVAAQTLRLAADLIESRRSHDPEATAEIVEAVIGLVSHMSVDLLTFDALCEVHVGAHRADARKPAADLASALDRFVERSDSPVVLDIRLAWSRLEAAVAAGDAAAVSDAADELHGIEVAAELAPALCAAADQWSAVMRGSIVEAPLLEALDALETGGYVWEAAALAGQAAIRSDDPALAKSLLARGREYRTAETDEPQITSAAGLSDREIEIGLLVLSGHSYKEIGAQCYISPKTVEHHVAHIRQKLTAVGVPRSEFRAKLQADLHGD